jgi:transposase InsO family protein
VKPWNRIAKNWPCGPFDRLFRERGLPQAIRSDNGVPFASPHALFQLSKLSVWWLRLGTTIERIRPGHPQQNGRHERMHLTLKKEATRPAGANILQQQGKFDTFIEEFNNERPHQTLAMQCPAQIYTASARPYVGIPEPNYPFHDKTVLVTCCAATPVAKHRKRAIILLIKNLLLRGVSPNCCLGLAVPEDQSPPMVVPAEIMVAIVRKF